MILVSILIILQIQAPIFAETSPAVINLDNLKQKALTYYQFDEKVKYLEDDWKKQLENEEVKESSLSKIIETDDNLRKARQYISTDDYKSMRDDLDVDEAANFLIIKGYLSMQDYIKIKILNDNERILMFFNDDHLVKEYYEYKLNYLPSNYIEAENRINMIQTTKMGIDQLENSIKQQKAQLDAEKAKLGIDISKAYTDYIIAQKSIENAKNNLSAAKKVYYNEEAKYKAGLISKLEYTEAKFEMQKNENEYNKAIRNIEKVKTVIETLTGIIIDESVLLDTNIELNNINEINANKLIQKYEKENETLNILMETSVNPAISLFDITKKEVGTEDKLYQEAKGSMEKAQIEYEQYKSKMVAAIRQQISSIRMTISNISYIRNNLKVIECEKSLAYARREVGMATDLDILRLENTYNTQKTSLYNLECLINYQWDSLQYLIIY